MCNHICNFFTMHNIVTTYVLQIIFISLAILRAAATLLWTPLIGATLCIMFNYVWFLVAAWYSYQAPLSVGSQARTLQMQVAIPCLQDLPRSRGWILCISRRLCSWAPPRKALCIIVSPSWPLFCSAAPFPGYSTLPNGSAFISK